MPPTEKIPQNWIPLDRLDMALQVEPAIFILFTALSAFIVYKLFLKDLSPERHRNLRRLFRNLTGHCLLLMALLAFYWLISAGTLSIPQLLPVVGLVAVFSGAFVFVKSFRIFAFEYLFFTNMQTGVPLLLVNILTLLVSLVLGAWIATAVFQVRLAPVLATSALFSIVLGLALQDTLGNLFSGVAIQLDKPYTLGDWVEVQNTTQKLVGQVYEITWRATTLVSFTEEMITIPNRIVAQSEVLNFSKTLRPVLRSHIFRIEFGEDIDKVKKVLLQTASGIQGIRKHPSPLCLVSEATDSWMAVKLIYCPLDFGDQFLVADRVITACVRDLRQAGIRLASTRLAVLQPKDAA